MDSQQALRARSAQQERDVAMMADPTTWPLWPFLPLDRPQGAGQFPELGVLYDAKGCGLDGYQTTVFLANVCDISSGAELVRMPSMRYDSYAAIAADWRVC